MRLLVVDDEADLAEAVAVGLRQEGYAVDTVGDGTEALEALAVTPYDLVVLDLVMPRVDGWEVMRRLREGNGSSSPRPAPRLLLLTARDGLRDRVHGLDAGADDYLVKPFAFAELAARVRAVLRRDSGRQGATLEVGSLVVDEARHEVWRGERLVNLTAKEFTLLRYLASRAGEVVSAEELLEHVWDGDTDPFSNVVRVAIGTVRRKLAPGVAPDDPAQPVVTVVNRGYRLREDVV